MLTAIATLWLKFGALPKWARYALYAVTALALLLSAKALYDRHVIQNHERDRAVQSIDARDHAAEERASDTISNADAERARTEAIRAAPSAGATVAPSTRALNCKRLQQAYTAAELARMPGYGANCA